MALTKDDETAIRKLFLDEIRKVLAKVIAKAPSAKEPRVQEIAHFLYFCVEDRIGELDE